MSGTNTAASVAENRMPGLSRHRRRIKIIIVLIAIAIAYPLYSYLDFRSRMNCTLQWARLNPFPASAQNVQISTTGSMFTRAFRASFKAPQPDIDAWLASSPGTKGLTPTFAGSRVRKYQVAPGGGAQHASLTVDEETGSVEIYVYWS